jgi:hypothetical protein
LKPNEFWELFPKDIMIMNEGFQMKQEYEYGLHLETLRLLRYGAYVNYMAIPTKKSHKKEKLTKFYSLPKDPKSEELTKEEAIDIFNRKELLITNGKKRGYLERGTNRLYNDKDVLIGYVKDDLIEYIN